jgi:cell division protein FtsB
MAGSAPGSRRSGTRPGRLGTGDPARRRRGRRVGPVNTKRAAILALVVCALALTIAAPLRTYLGQRGKIAEQQDQQRALTAQLHRLQHRKELLSDPQYIRIQARERLLYVEKGATPYIVAPRDHGGRRKPAEHHDGAWYQKLWASLSGSGG